MADCLSGLSDSDINITMMYGEGSSVFYRLQEQIGKQNIDLFNYLCKGEHETHR